MVKGNEQFIEKEVHGSETDKKMFNLITEMHN